MSAAAASRSARRAAAAAQHVKDLRDEVDLLDRRASGLAAEVTALTGRRDALLGYPAAGPVAGDERFHQFAGLATGGAIAAAVNAGPARVAAAVREVSGSTKVSTTSTIDALVDLAAEAISWAAVLSFADGEESARVPLWDGRQGVGRRIEDARGAFREIREGRIVARDVIAGSVAGSVVRRLGRSPWDTILIEGGYSLAQVMAAATSADTPQGVRLADLSPDDRTQILRALAGA